MLLELTGQEQKRNFGSFIACILDIIGTYIKLAFDGLMVRRWIKYLENASEDELRGTARGRLGCHRAG